MPPKRERRPAGYRTALGKFDSTNGRGFNPNLGRKQDTANAQGIADLRFRRAVDRLHRLGPRALYELLVELGATRLIPAEIERQVGRYAALDPNILSQLGGDRVLALPLHCIGERR